MKSFLITLGIALACQVALGMVGSPLFCVGQQLTSMTVEASRANLNVGSPDNGDETQAAASDRLMLTARYGLTSCLDAAASIGTANLTFRDLPFGYNDFAASWSLAWGASVRAGWPNHARRYQVVATVNYVGFQPKASISNGTKSISSQYVWHEVSPSLTFGMKLSHWVPYVGLSKPFLFGERDVRVVLRGEEFPSAGGRSEYTDSEQPLRGVLGLEWRLPEGYSISAEAATTSDGTWTMAIGLAQVLR